MLVELSIRDFALIEEIRIPFEKGLNILTGETGAGKSMILGAAGLLAGQRASADMVRHGRNKAVIEGLFEVEAQHPVTDTLNELGIETEEDEMLVVRREISAKGKSISRINGQLVNLAMLKEVSPQLIAIHGQHDNTSLLAVDKQVDWLDAYGDDALHHTRKEFLHLYERYRRFEKELRELSKSEQEVAQRLDILQYQLNEIESADLQPGEDDELAEERKKWMNVEKIYEGLEMAYDALNGDQKALDWLGHAQSQLESAAEFDEQVQHVHASVEAAFYQLEDHVHTLRQYRDELQFDPERLNQIEQRLDQIQTLKRKYGNRVDDILEFAASISDELDEVHHRDSRIEQIRERLEETERDLVVEAKELSKLRRQTADRLTRNVEKILEDLHMEKTAFHVQLRTVPDENGVDVDGERLKVSAKGLDDVEFQMAPNQGEPLRPLSKIASGGELSRIMLAFRSLMADTENIDTMIFDEIDTGVSGRAAQAIAEKLAMIAKNRQVLCITHLPQVACMAEAHYLIEKRFEKGETQTGVDRLNDDHRIHELARMLGGVEVTSVTTHHAREMLQMADDVKKAI